MRRLRYWSRWTIRFGRLYAKAFAVRSVISRRGRSGSRIVILAIPMILEMSMESLFAVVDIFFVAKLGADAVAIVGLTESVMALIYAVAFGLAIGATATIARRTGEKDEAGAAKSAAHVIYLGIIVSLLISAIGTHFRSAHPSIARRRSAYHRGRFRIHADHDRRQRGRAFHLSAERDLSRCRRCSDRDASSLAREHP